MAKHNIDVVYSGVVDREQYSKKIMYKITFRKDWTADKLTKVVLPLGAPKIEVTSTAEGYIHMVCPVEICPA